ncbi:gfo/Idh/MocA family oxidoreductase [Rhodococcus sp. ACS1]|uniref:Predicted dehydrogenase n=1 Tax=Rhodococcus koreensis TaxID=99653 RepID=A0A1H4Y9D3_9NOCA|nr:MULTISPECIES: Gfo/Idh/MocA family oxidoreductase [Rhodococcus]PBC48579.1 gfo/Idh/MocA family oxidoreductase [Rhodococcus sp. ACS1]QSE79930.1 Gfo/Idh/MocA family oxidoreductase [Rhodococcus koreensis]SED13880.1 Predicted dehydrogenase [Rhodococcus koreensis]
MTRRVVVVGAGLASAAHLTALRAVGADVVGVVTRDETRAAAAHRLAPEARILPSLDAAAALDADTAVVVTPPSSHLAVASALAERGLDLVIDKPLAASLPDAQAIVDVAERAGVRAAVTLQHRYKEAAVRARQLLADGAIGTLRSATVTVPLWRPDSYYAEAGRGTWDRDGGGALITQAIHTLDLYLSLTGPARSVVAASSTSRGRLEAEDTIHLLIDQGTHAASVTASTAAWPGGAETIHLFGDAGQLRLVGDSLVRIGDGARTLVDGTVDASGPDPLSMSAWFRSLYEDVFTSWAAGAAPLSDARSGLRVQSVIDAAYRSAAAGTTPEIVSEERESACQS